MISKKIKMISNYVLLLKKFKRDKDELEHLMHFFIIMFNRIKTSLKKYY